MWRTARNVAGRKLYSAVQANPATSLCILAVLEAGPRTVPELTAALKKPSHEVMVWLMGLRKYGWVAELKEVADEGYYRYEAVERGACDCSRQP